MFQKHEYFGKVKELMKQTFIDQIFMRTLIFRTEIQFFDDFVIFRNSLIDYSCIYSYLKLAISDDDTIRTQDVNTVLDSVSNADSFGVDAMLDFLIKHYKDLWE